MRIRTIIRSLRLYSLPATFVPVFTAVCFAGYINTGTNYAIIPFIILCAVCLHLGCNLWNDYQDYKIGLDTVSNKGGSGVLPQKQVPAKRILLAGFFFLIAGASLGIFILSKSSPVLIPIGIAGVLCAALYTGPFYSLKYIALGDICVFTSMGLGLTIGTYIAITGEFTKEIFYIAIIPALFVTAILQSNNIADRDYDLRMKIKTVGNQLPLQLSKIYMYVLVLAPFILQSVLVAKSILPVASFVTILSFPAAFAIILKTKRSIQGSDIYGLRFETPRLYLVYGVLFNAALLVKV